MMSSANWNVNEDLEALFSTCPQHYVRLQASLWYPIGLDRADPDSVSKLVEMGQQLAEDNSDRYL